MLASLLRIILLTATLKILERGLDKGPIIVSYSISNPKSDLTKETVDTAAKAIVDSKIFATTEGGNLTALKSSQIVTRKVETLE